MSNPTAANRKTSNPARPPWHLAGKESIIVTLRDEQGLTFDDIGFKVGCSGEGARGAYNRAKKKLEQASSEAA